MATISTDTYLDGGTARTAGETWTINGCKLIIRTDTRWHANAPASMTGSLGTMTTSTALGGGIQIDGTKVRVVPFNTGSGNVPAIGTSITQGGVSGYLLGVWAVWQSAPTAVGAAMPATGFLKFREVTGGSFSAGALSGISASATSADVAGWIEVCIDSNSSFALNDLGDGLVSDGQWFDLGTTNGSAGQTFQVPTNGGGSGTHVFGVQIETAPGSGVYDWYPTAHATLGGAIFTTANLNTDLRSKFVESSGNGVVRIGTDGTSNIGYVPASGCKVRIPNIFIRTVATASRAVNQVPGAVTRGNLSGGNYNAKFLHMDLTLPNSSTVSPKVNFQNCVVENILNIVLNAVPCVIDNCCIGGFTFGASTKSTFVNASNVTLSNTKMVGSMYSIGTFNLNNSSDITVTNCEFINAKTRTAAAQPLYIQGSSNCTFTNTKIKGGGCTITTGSDYITFTNTDYVDRLEGATTTATGANIFTLNTVANSVIDGITFGEGGVLSNTQCYSNMISTQSINTNIKVRNIGTRSAPLNTGSANRCQGVVSASNTDKDWKIQRIFVTTCRLYLISMSSIYSHPNWLVEDVYAQSSSGWPIYGTDCTFRKVCNHQNNNNGRLRGVNFVDSFSSDTAGAVTWFAGIPTTASSAYLTSSIAANQGSGYINSSGSFSLDTQDDYIISESKDWIKGHTGFQNSAPTIGGTVTGIAITYDLDTGSGFSGTWKTLSGANLSAETISPTGFKMRLKFTQTGTGNTSTAVGYVKINTISTLEAQTDNVFPLDTNTLSFTGLATGSEVRCYVGTDPATAVEIGGTESAGSSSFTFSHSSGGQAGYIVILAMGYQPIRFDYTYKTSDDSILIQPVIDRNYSNPA